MRTRKLKPHIWLSDGIWFVDLSDEHKSIWIQGAGLTCRQAWQRYINELKHYVEKHHPELLK